MSGCQTGGRLNSSLILRTNRVGKERPRKSHLFKDRGGEEPAQWRAGSVSSFLEMAMKASKLKQEIVKSVEGFLATKGKSPKTNGRVAVYHLGTDVDEKTAQTVCSSFAKNGWGDRVSIDTDPGLKLEGCLPDCSRGHQVLVFA